MKRDLKRLYRQHGIRYFAMPLVVVLLLATLADQRLPEYLEHREQAADLQAQHERDRELLSLAPKLQRSHDELAAPYAALAPRLLTEPPEQALATLQATLDRLLRSLYMENIEFSDPQLPRRSGAERIAISARFTAVPQQLPRLQAALAAAPQLLQVQAIELRVVPDPQRNSQQLAVTARFAALHAPAPPEPASDAASTPTGKAAGQAAAHTAKP